MKVTVLPCLVVRNRSMVTQTCMYEGIVVHKRLKPKAHRFSYKACCFLFDLSELQAIDKNCILFSYNRWAPISFFDKDHGSKDGKNVLKWVGEQLHEANVSKKVDKVKLLCFPRVFGFVFNPLSTYFCYDKTGMLFAILYEVSNTFKESHTYILPVNPRKTPVIRQSCTKQLYVSPFIEMETDYHFRLVPPANKVSIVIRQDDRSGALLAASFVGKKKEFTFINIVNCLIQYPFLTVKVILGIHWEAFRLFLKGLPIIPHVAAEKPIKSSNLKTNKPRFK